MKTALIIGAAAVGAYALWRWCINTTAAPGTANGDAAANMTPTARARTAFGPGVSHGLGALSVRGTGLSVDRPAPYSAVLGDVARREFAPLATTASHSSNHWSETGIRSVGGTAPDGTPRGLGDPSSRVN